MALKSCVFVVGLCLVVAASARPRYIAVPLAADLRIVELDEGHARVPRQAEKALEEPSGGGYRFERQAGGGGGDGHEHVDYGAHTGHHGAFGWYADYPVHAHN